MSWYGAQTQPAVESDDVLRARLLYVAKPDYEREIRAAHGEALDEIAWRWNLKRRRL